MKLAEFIQDNMEIILQEWETFAATLFPAAVAKNSAALRDHAREILLAVAADMQTVQTSGEQKEKSLGRGEEASQASNTAATVHGELRHDVGFDIIQLVAEYRALRASVLRLWIREGHAKAARDFDDMLRFNEGIDQAIAESVSSYSTELDKARDTFTAILGHDLRSPLGAIVMAAHNAASQDLPERATHAISAIQRSAKVMQLLIRDLLDFAAARLGHEMPMRPEESSLVEACHAAVAELMAAHPDRTFEFEHDGELRGEFDPVRIGQALSNLLNNAINHGEKDHPVQLQARAEQDDLVVDVTNKGKAIPADALRGLMNDPIARGPLAGSEGSSGLGLGLYIAQQVAKAHGGSITAASNKAQTRFSLRLPRVPQAS